MITKGEIPLALVTLNKGKLSQFQRNTPIGSNTLALRSLFDEDTIKEGIAASQIDGCQYVAEISQAKFEKQRQSLLQIEGEDKDYIILVSDSVLIIPENGKNVAVNRDDNQYRRDLAAEAINSQGILTYVGAVTFGRKNGQSQFTILTYLDVPLRTSITGLPIPIENIPAVVDEQMGFEAGYIRTNLKEDGNLVFSKFPWIQSSTFDDENNESSVRPFISGLNRDVIALAEKTGQFDLQIAGVLENLVESYPFNTLSFYASSGHDVNLKTYYRQIVENHQNFFNLYGGNCSFFTLELADNLKKLGFDPNVVIYPTYKPSEQNGHSGILTTFRGQNFYLDPGLSIPSPMPVSIIPLYPFKTGDPSKFFLLGVRDVNGDYIPDIVLVNKKKEVPLLAQRVITPEQFKSALPEILLNLHNKRSFSKMDFHDRTGKRKFGIIYDLSGLISIRGSEGIILQFHLKDLDDNIQLITEMCETCNLSPNLILGQLNNLR